MRLIGINGGTFDPIHFGHLRPVLEVMTRLNLDQVRFIPCAQPVHRDTPNVDAEARCRMIELAIGAQEKFVLDRIEIERDGPSYMVMTLDSLAQKFPEDSLVLILGSDAFAKFSSWHQWQRILQLANLVVMHRPGELPPQDGEAGKIFRDYAVAEFTEPHGQIIDLGVTQLDISSTFIRQCLSAGEPVDYLLPEGVAAYIRDHQLYSSF
ncbi:nicotinate-nucleotide adenylyltransferase [Thiomicrorhabdus heinhorstiae]|uniref:Probable nicotinate-nucleotide adenylyltransferase n=1 Tax=Thiomicrorhabdus heinhorstiae TaxID=2748010 RepID=A0ABS0BXS9_9GAMM|nr:nicotinate-nucleotide adenylyltransferase [Thiomicrorhabdus heinhorstiae]MBF6058603.1 nicotinate-nucleotide adenylyltransferase [Thiomicrorhabdus heinhorstiae]